MDDMRKILAGLIVVVVACSGAWGQTHKVAKPENVVRAVGVYEWTGDLAKPGASRLIPVTLFIDGELQDAGVYMARPVPFALLTGCPQQNAGALGKVAPQSTAPAVSAAPRPAAPVPTTMTSVT